MLQIEDAFQAETSLRSKEIHLDESLGLETTASGPSRILIVDDHKLFADVICCALSKSDEIDVIGTAVTCAEGLSLARRLEPDLVLVDFCLPDGDGVSLAQAILAERPTTKVLVISASDELAAQALATATVHGYLSKDTPLTQFLSGVQAVLQDGDVLPLPRQAAASTPLRRSSEELRIAQLTGREREVLALLIDGAGSDEIARSLAISTNTVRSHVQNILTKLQVRSRLEAVAFAVRHRALETALSA